MNLKKPTKFQLQILKSRAKRKVIRAGRRSGKTVAASLLALEAFGRGKRVLYAAPTAEQTDRFWTEVSRSLVDRVDAGIYKKSETERCIGVPGTDTRIRCKTAWDADTLRGDYADLLILDEAQLMNESAWEFVGAPMLLDNDGDAVFIYTPPSILDRAITKATDRRWVSKLFERARKEFSILPFKKRWQAFHSTSHENPHLSREALAEIASDMTVLAYRQEILAQDIDQVPGALWTQALLDKTRIAKDALPPLVRIVIGIDPSGSSRTECGIVAAGIDRDSHRYVLRDVSIAAATPEVWAAGAIALYHELKADCLVVETNYGGAMCEAVLRTVDPDIPVRTVTATRGKLVRAEPICASFEKNRVHLVGSHPQLEEELCTYVPGNASPNRLDAMVWACTELGGEGTLVFGLLELQAQGEALQAIQEPPKAIVTTPVAAEGSSFSVAGQKFPPQLPPRAKTFDLPPCQLCGSEIRVVNEVLRTAACTKCHAEVQVHEKSPLAPIASQNRGDFLQSRERDSGSFGRGSRSPFGRFGQ